MTTLSDSAYLLAPYQGQQPPAPSWFTKAVAHRPEQQFFESEGTRIELLTWGEVGKPGLLFLHGNGAHAHWWSHIAPFFAADWRCAALSLSGMGQSDHRTAGYTLAEFAKETVDAIAAASLDSSDTPPIAISHSMGGMVALATAATYQPFQAIVTIDSPLMIDPVELQTFRATAPKARREHQTFSTLEEGLARFRLSPPQSCDNHYIVDHIARHSLNPVARGWQWHFDPQRVRMNSEDGPTLANSLSCPLALVYGEESAMLKDKTLELSLNALPKGSPVIPIPDAEHHIMLDQPLALITALRALLASWPQAPSQQD